jgi:thiamine biosynthesis lipoprotein
MTRVLVDMGEVLAMGTHPDGKTWRVALPVGDDNTRFAGILDIADTAVATSSSRATRFDPAGNFGHIFDPSTGRCTTRSLSITVTSSNATAADALSTALAAMPEEQATALLTAIPNATGRITRF